MNRKLISDFWLDEDAISDELDFTKNGQFEGNFDPRIIELASARRAVGNFVCILTNQDIPVLFLEQGVGAPGATDGKKVYISASITNRNDFDWGVGLALHEGSHIKLTDMAYFLNLSRKIPQSLVKIAEEKGVDKDHLTTFSKFLFNYVEDRYIDTYIFDTAPGYRGYYKALYDKFFYSPEISKALKSKGWRIPTMASYEMRIVNMTNPASDKNALPDLAKIFSIIDVKNIRRLKTTKERFDVAMQIAEIAINNIDPDEQEKEKNKTDETIQKILDVLGQKGGAGGDGENSKKGKSYILQIGDHGFSEKELKKILKALQKQREFLLGQIDKKEITKEQNGLLKTLEESGIHIVQADFEGNGVPKVDCIVVKKLTKSLLESGMVPMSAINAGKFSSWSTVGDCVAEAVNRGVIIGTSLGKKLSIRREENLTKFNRRREGKIDRRMLAGIGAGLEDIFHTIRVDKYGKANLHITVDASSSMSETSKWGSTMTCVVAICKAASSIPNLRVSVSFRSTVTVGSEEKPYIILAYDSEVDKFEKVRLLFPHLVPHGTTPEGLAMDATIKTFISKTLDGSEYYFLNLSDGEPWFSNNQVSYSGNVAVNHTRQVIQKLRKNGLTILSYFISGGYDNRRNDFLTMYGKDAKFINVTSVVDIAKTMNNMFLRKQT